MGQIPLGKYFKCSQCMVDVWKKPSKTYKEKFCSSSCYFLWKKSNPNKVAYKDKIFVSGYFYIYMPNHPKAIKNGRYIAEHRLVAEKIVGRILNHNEIAHHKNGIKTDNRKCNIEVMTISEHNRYHAKLRKRGNNGKF